MTSMQYAWLLCLMGGILVLMMLWAMTRLSARMLVLSWMLATVSISLATKPLVSSSFATTNCVLRKNYIKVNRYPQRMYLQVMSVEEKGNPCKQLSLSTVFTSHPLSSRSFFIKTLFTRLDNPYLS